jgi:hypothetical protein
MAYAKGYHQCPAPKCSAQIPNRIFACGPHWRQLSPGTRKDIYETAALPVLHPDRREVFRRAEGEWERLSHP